MEIVFSAAPVSWAEVPRIAVGLGSLAENALFCFVLLASCFFFLIMNCHGSIYGRNSNGGSYLDINRGVLRNRQCASRERWIFSSRDAVPQLVGLQHTTIQKTIRASAPRMLDRDISVLTTLEPRNLPLSSRLTLSFYLTFVLVTDVTLEWGWCYRQTWGCGYWTAGLWNMFQVGSSVDIMETP